MLKITIKLRGLSGGSPVKTVKGGKFFIVRHGVLFKADCTIGSTFGHLFYCRRNSENRALQHLNISLHALSMVPFA